MKSLIFLLCLATAAVFGAETRPLYLDQDQPIEARVEDLLSRLTLQEKISLVHANSTFTTAAIPRLSVPCRWMDDGPNGVREDISPNSWDLAGHTDDFSTAMPVGICLAATWDPSLAWEKAKRLDRRRVPAARTLCWGRR